ncbi:MULTISPECIES: response regulator transcription factor [Bacillota]|uniref:response regulator transcription factor n=1 Tax=Bacillota TaxID=1239 RepID=UPI0026739374|nr:response regulator [uncultured Clostridium sp.]
MIKVLIADDERFTRQGILDMVDWDKLNVSEVKEAYDGINALEILKDFEPNILLTDVRMPRLNGIDLAFKARELYPNCMILFMSGYSDKEYLKSAIKLKAINYVEKPIEIEELEENLNNAILEFVKNTTIHNSIEHTIANEISSIDNSEAVKSIISSYFSKDFNDKLVDGQYVSVLIKIYKIIPNKHLFIDKIREIIHDCGLEGFVSMQNEKDIVLQIFFSKNIKSIHNSNVFQSFFATLDEYIKNYSHFYIFVGSIVANMQDMHKSYASASSLDTLSFFKDYNSVIYFEEVPHKTCATIDPNAYSAFKRNLNNEDKQAVLSDINNITSEFMLNCGTDINEIKNVYNKLLLHIFNFCHSRNINLNNSVNENTSFNTILQFNNIFEIKHYMLEIIKDVFLCLKEKNIYNEPALNIIKYINEHYNSYDLSLEDISKNTFLTPAYICVIFKDFTGKTVNKYITEYRIMQAKELLKDSNIKMNDIALKVGYRDGNYFAKIFKKETGYSPSEYRRKFL